MRKSFRNLLFIVLLVGISCSESPKKETTATSLPVYKDVPYLQDYSIKYDKQENDLLLFETYMDRNGVIQVSSSDGILRTHDGQFLYPGVLLQDKTYRPLTDKNISAMTVYQDQFVYLDDKAVLSNAWAGSLYLKHTLPKANIFTAGTDFDFLISDGPSLQYVSKNNSGWQGSTSKDKTISIKFDQKTNSFWILGEKSINHFNPKDKTLKTVYEGNNFTSFALVDNTLILTTLDGYYEVDATSGNQIGDKKTQLPWTEINYVNLIDGNLWFGSTKGAFKLKEDGKFSYYYGKRWMPSNNVKHISKGTDGSILILTDTGLGQIVFEEMTLYDKALYYEKQVRDRHIRLGFNATLVDMDNGNFDTGRLSDSDNDGLWTTMYLAGQVFRYSVTKSEDALQNCREAMDAMERLFSINPVPGFPSRSFERSGYINQLHDPDRWQHSSDPEWDWKSTTSSDEAIGHIFAYGAMAEIMDNDLKDRAIVLIDTLMSHIVRNDMYMVDYDGKPTTWGRWNPEYVNARPKMVGDRKINASNIIGMLQTAYHFTGKEKYKEKAFDLMDNHGYLDNLMWPMKDVAMAPDDADDWSKMLSESWNHSDDEMYFVGYWGLYRYAFNDTLKTKFKEAIIDHWEIERPEKEGAWNIMTALTGTQEFDLEEAAWYLREHPMDMVAWEVNNSHRKDITFVEPNFREQTTAEVLPPDERRVQRHNANMFTLDGGRNGSEEFSAGDIWLLPYWMGRYLGVISAPQTMD
ncbi:ligand-binding sensor domain-containing protein [Arenibacter troitsensis]|uniref:Two component regulator propeller n=1 Tax=Arenibacter troitsensis TaxID=188872 RepID=A0A1X7JIL8_9FLAO|nr:hypothetical protein [Arenibacter troitsensis]SMG27391.1 hypothetical protein SAMN03080602_01855 [Arenibacter troitsensis]